MSEQPQPPKEAAFFTSIREWGLVRGTKGVVGGVIEGLGNRIGLARVPARLLTVVAWILLPGIVMVAYAASWALLPDARGNIIIQNFGRGVTNVGALIGIAFLSFVGFLSFDNGPIFNTLRGGRDFYLVEDVSFGLVAVLIPLFIFLAFVTGAIVLVVWLAKRSNRNTADAQAKTHAYGTQATGGSSAAGPSTAQHASAPTSSTGTPQPWEPALLPGDPRAGVPASAGAKKAPANAAHSAGATQNPTTATHAATGSTGPSAASAAAAPPPPPAPPAPPARPPAPTVPGPGQGGYLAFAAVLLISAAIAAGMARADMLTVSPVIAWGAAITVGLGVVLFFVALAGRQFGFLGFLSVFAVLLAVLFAANAKEIVSNFEDGRDWWRGSHNQPRIEVDEPVASEPAVTHGFDLTAELAADYSTVFLAGACMSPSDVASWTDATFFGESMATMRLDAVDEDIDVDLAATYTRLAIPAGTSLEITGSGSTDVVWEGRDASCSNWFNHNTEWDGEPAPPESHTILTATNPDAPVITINAGTDKTIYIEEVAK